MLYEPGENTLPRIPSSLDATKALVQKIGLQVANTGEPKGFPPMPVPIDGSDIPPVSHRGETLEVEVIIDETPGIHVDVCRPSELPTVRTVTLALVPGPAVPPRQISALPKNLRDVTPISPRGQ